MDICTIARAIKGMDSSQLDTLSEFLRDYQKLTRPERAALDEVIELCTAAGRHDTGYRVPLNPTSREKHDITDRELDDEEKGGNIVSFHFYVWYSRKGSRKAGRAAGKGGHTARAGRLPFRS